MHRIYVDGVLRRRQKTAPTENELRTLEEQYRAALTSTVEKTYYEWFTQKRHIEYLFRTRPESQV